MNALFFDLDGTLIDSRADLAAAVNALRAELALAPKTRDEIVAHVGNGARRLLEETVPERAGHFDELWPRYAELYAAHCLDETTLYPGVRSTLDELRDRGWLLGVNTNKPAFATQAILAHFGLTRHFGSAVVAGGDCPEMKPSAQTLRLCASRMRGHRLSSHDWMVGDNWTDLACAANAGIKSAFCTFGFGRLADARYTQKINRFDELLRYCKPED